MFKSMFVFNSSFPSCYSPPFFRLGEQGWCSGESTRLPSAWPRFDSRSLRHMWVEFVVGSLPSPRGFSPVTPVFPSPHWKVSPISTRVLKAFDTQIKCFIYLFYSLSLVKTSLQTANNFPMCCVIIGILSNK